MKIIKKTYLNPETIIFSTYLAFSLCRFAFPSLEITLAMIAIGFLPIFYIQKIKYRKYIFIFTISLLFYYIFTCFLLNRYDALPRNILHLVDCFLIALLILSGKIRSWGVYVVFYGLCFYFLTFILRGVPVQEVLDYSSWNGISILLIISCVSLYVVNSFQNNDIELLPAVLALTFSFWGMGRSGILSCSIIVLGVFFLKFRSIRSFLNINNIVIFLFLITALVLMYISNDYIFSIVQNTIKIVNRDTVDISTGRFEIWDNYYANLDMLRLFFGSNIYTDPWPKGEELAYNLHNSFLRLFAYTGLMGLLAIILLNAALIYFFYKNKLFFILLLALIIRGFTDTIFFFESWDFLLFFFIFYFLNDSSAIDVGSLSRLALKNKIRS